jgi:peptidylprolyl isomerase
LPGVPVTDEGKDIGQDILAWTLVPGTGDMLPVEPTMATMRINAWSMNGTRYFGDPDGPDELVLPTDDASAFSGWSTALSDMKVGETRKVWIGAADRTRWPLESGTPQDLVMDIELVSFGDEPPLPDPLPGAPLAGAARNGSSSGLRWYDIGAGSGPPLAAGDTATIRCTGWLADGSPWHTTDAVTVTIDASLMPALAEGLIGMTPGSTRKLVVPPTLGVGFDPLGSLPPGSTILLDVEYIGSDGATASADGT